ncbi:helix-turn-helix domain-containing protein [uncultured Streptomyces sp.]|uniref:helix-turn-helix domain-containing protein n=1 Tax=uncultured Streptomyces sp. TaxID=174707 RepID=UPI002608A035|nr:helix-turn-helix domain-containing protein [uncultured Streptomyces sp.]
MSGPRRDTRGIVDPAGLLTRVRFRRHEPAPALRPYLEHYWFIDWDLPAPWRSRVVPHPSVNLVFQRYGTGDAAARGDFAEVAGVGTGLDVRTLEGTGRVCGVQFRPGAFRPFAPGHPVSDWTGRNVPARQVFRVPDPARPHPSDVLGPDDDPARVAALDAFLLALGPRPDPRADHATALAALVRADRSVRRVDRLARTGGMSVRSLQRLFAAYVGVGPKWVVLRHRLHEALERAGRDAAEVDWARLAAELGYSDQPHLVRDFTATLGVPPTALAP